MKRTLRAFPVLWLGAVALLYIGLVIVYKDLSPFYDGGIYYSNITRLITTPFSWVHLHMERHISPFYTLLIALPQMLDQGNMVLIYATNFSLALMAVASLYFLMRHMLGAIASEEELILAASIFALTPVFLVHAFHLNLDFPLAAFFVPFVLFLMLRRPWIAGAFALAMMFSKETGVYVYSLTIGLYLLLYVLLPASSVKGFFRNIRNELWMLIPIVLFEVYKKTFELLAIDAGYWHQGDTFPALFDFNIFDPSLQAFLGNIFLLNFHWIPSLTIALCACVSLVCLLRGGKHILPKGINKTDVLFTVLLLLGLAYLTSRVRPWNNPRYVLVAFPILFIVMQISLVVLVRSVRIRLAVLSTTLVFVALSTVKTIDPISKLFYGTIPFGNHQWLNMTSKLGPEWLRRDPQLYNLEALQLHYALADLFADIRPVSDMVIIGGRAFNFFIAYRMDQTTFHPTWKLENSIPIRWIDDLELLSPQRLSEVQREQKTVVFVAFPNLDNEQHLAVLRQHYTEVGVKQYGRGGYTISAYTFTMP